MCVLHVSAPVCVWQDLIIDSVGFSDKLEQRLLEIVVDKLWRIFVSLGSTPDDAQGIVLALPWGIVPGEAQTTQLQGVKLHLAVCKAHALLAVLSLQPMNEWFTKLFFSCFRLYIPNKMKTI